MHAVLSYCGNRPTQTHTNKHTHLPTYRQDRLQYTVPQLDSVQCNDDPNPKLDIDFT